MRKKLFNLLYTKSFIYREDPPFTLASGKISPYYFNCKSTILDPEGCFLIGSLVFQEIRNENLDAIGGLTLGADPISIATSLEAYRAGLRIHPLIVRKEAKKHGTEKWIEGNLQDIKKVIVIDDVITTGNSTIKAVQHIREAGLNVVKALVVIDREEGGRENIESMGIKVVSLFKRSDFDKRRLQEI